MGCGWHSTLRVSHRDAARCCATARIPILALLRRYALDYIKEFQYDEDNGDNDQNVNPGTEVRQGWNYDRTKKAQQPQDYQNHDNNPQHEVSPFE
jgi:rubredoxin